MGLRKLIMAPVGNNSPVVDQINGIMTPAMEIDDETGFIYVGGRKLGGGGGGGTPGGDNTQVQINGDGVFAGSPSFTFDPSTLELRIVSGPGTSNSISLNGGGVSLVMGEDGAGIVFQAPGCGLSMNQAAEAFIAVGALFTALGIGFGSTGKVAIAGAAGQLTFFNDDYINTGGATKQTVTGSKGGNAALASLIAAFAAYGLITDGTS